MVDVMHVHYFTVCQEEPSEGSILESWWQHLFNSSVIVWLSPLSHTKQQNLSRLIPPFFVCVCTVNISMIFGPLDGDKCVFGLKKKKL